MIEKIADDLVASVQEYMRRGIAGVVERLKVAESRLASLPQDLSTLKGADGKDGVDGKDAPVIDLAAVAKEASELVIVPPPGRDGADGKDAEPADEKAISEKVLQQITLPNDGKDGKDGLNGKDADEEAITAKLLIEFSKAFDAIPRPKDGNDGKDGANGIDAAPVDEKAIVSLVLRQIPTPKDGKDAPLVDTEKLLGEVLKRVPTPKDGRDGANGKDGVSVKGDAGIDGRDAIQIEVLDGIDPFKRYQRGTFATFRGGMVRSFRATDPLGDSGELEKNGWHVTQNGIDREEQTTEQEGRIVRRVTHYTNGRSSEMVTKVAALLDRGIFDATKGYEQGDVVTWNGSMWIARSATSEKPSESEDWRLSVKCGRNGRDGIKGETGLRGAEGRAGRL